MYKQVGKNIKAEELIQFLQTALDYFANTRDGQDTRVYNVRLVVQGHEYGDYTGINQKTKDNGIRKD